MRLAQPVWHFTLDAAPKKPLLLALGGKCGKEIRWGGDCLRVFRLALLREGLHDLGNRCGANLEKTIEEQRDERMDDEFEARRRVVALEEILDVRR